MGKKNKKFKYNEIERHQFHQRKYPTSIYDVEINEILVFGKIPLGEKAY